MKVTIPSWIVFQRIISFLICTSTTYLWAHLLMKIAICDVEGRTTKGIKQNLCVMYSIAMESPQGYPHYTKEDLHIMKRSIPWENALFFGPLCLQFFFHDIFLPRSVYLIVLYNVLAGQDCNLVFSNGQIISLHPLIVSCHLLVFIIFVQIKSNWFFNGILFFLVAFWCIFVLDC